MFIIYANTIQKECKQKWHGFVAISRHLIFDTMLFASDLVLLTTSEDVLQCSICNLNTIATEYNEEITTEMTVILAFQVKQSILSKNV